MLKKVLSTAAIAAFAWAPTGAYAQSATYYASYFDGRPTASGEIFYNSGYTAAHPSYAFGTRVLVTNRHDGRSVEVRINDRCSCSIDLSQAAAAQIGLLQAGRLPVSIQVLN